MCISFRADECRQGRREKKVRRNGRGKYGGRGRGGGNGTDRRIGLRGADLHHGGLGTCRGLPLKSSRAPYFCSIVNIPDLSHIVL